MIDRVAYTWFNRFTALRYMDARGYLVPRVVSPADGDTWPEILSQAAQGILPDHVRKEVAAQVRDLLEGRAPSREPQVEAYRRLVVASCNALHGLMPFLFERIADYTELLMPNELLAETGWVAELRAVMTPVACEDVEIIGWLYQFYISEKKDEVFGRPSGQKIEAADIPAATQLFTPHWIVRYLVENSLGRLWLLNHPESGLAAKMDYYIAPEEPETDFLRVSSPEEIRICDPACGSGHMLTYAFDLLYEIYLERGYAPRDIPGLILTHNLTGLEIDERAGGLAAFALMMKAANQLGRRGFLRMEARPDVVVLEDVSLRLSDFNNLLTGLGYDLNVDRQADGLKIVPLALSGIWSQVSAYLKWAEGLGFEDGFEEAATAFGSGLADEIGLFDEAANNPFLVNQLKELRTALVAIADADTKQRDRTELEREFGKRTGSPLHRGVRHPDRVGLPGPQEQHDLPDGTRHPAGPGRRGGAPPRRPVQTEGDRGAAHRDGDLPRAALGDGPPVRAGQELRLAHRPEGAGRGRGSGPGPDRGYWRRPDAVADPGLGGGGVAHGRGAGAPVPRGRGEPAVHGCVRWTPCSKDLG